MFTILSAVAEAERDRIRERIAVVKADQRARGRYLGGIAPFGWREGEDGALAEVPEQQAAIKAMRSLRAQGASLRQIAAAMRTAGHSISHEGVSAVLRTRMRDFSAFCRATAAPWRCCRRSRCPRGVDPSPSRYGRTTASRPGASMPPPPRPMSAGYARAHRFVPPEERATVFMEYGLDPHARGYEADHRVPLELAGTNDLANLWPEFFDMPWGAHVKDQLENQAHALVCSGAMSLHDAQALFLGDWIAGYQHVFGTAEVAPPPADSERGRTEQRCWCTASCGD